jgi:NAD(P)-dependent dehydrogenase (short-subunit alcohol dehydrogenase family)
VTRSYVVTGAGRGVGRAVVERLVGDGHAVVALDLDVGALDWVRVHPAGSRVVPIIGSAADESVAERAADAAQQAATLAGWVNNAAVFRDAAIHVAPAAEVLNPTGRSGRHPGQRPAGRAAVRSVLIEANLRREVGREAIHPRRNRTETGLYRS